MALREESRRDYATCDQKHDGGSPSIPPCAGSSSSGSSVVGAAINLFNSTIGAGVIGLGGAIAGSGGLVSAFLMIVFAVMGKLSFDIVISLAAQVAEEESTNTSGAANEAGSAASYEDLGRKTYGTYGIGAVMVFKGLIAFGCIVAYTVIVRDNFSSAVQGLFGVAADREDGDGAPSLWTLLTDEKPMTFFLSAAVMLPLSLLRSMAPLVRFSAVKVVTVYLIAFVLIILYYQVQGNSGVVKSDPSETAVGQSDDRDNNLRFFEHWVQIRPNLLSNMGTMLFGFVSQHTCHLVFQSLRPELRNIQGWKKVSTLSTAMSIAISFLIGFTAYATFWENTNSNLFLLYPKSRTVDLARILLCVMQLLTYPAPFFTCRELIILSLPLDLKEPAAATSVATTGECESNALLTPESLVSPWLLPGETTQLRQPYHVIFTVALWLVSLLLALSPLSLVDVMNIAGSVAGTMIAFVLPGLFYLKTQNSPSLTAFVLLIVGGFAGCIGTYFSVEKAIYEK